MNKFFACLFLIFLLSSETVFAENGMWDNFGDQNVYGQQAVTQEDFEKALESKKKKDKKKKDKNIPQGDNFSQSNETAVINDIKNDLQILLIPLDLKVKEGYIVPVGHYQVEGERDKNGEVFIKLYQAHDLIAKIPAEETNDDFGESTINFVKLLPHGDYHVQIIYGGLDFNAYAIIDTE